MDSLIHMELGDVEVREAGEWVAYSCFNQINFCFYLFHILGFQVNFFHKKRLYSHFENFENPLIKEERRLRDSVLIFTSLFRALTVSSLKEEQKVCTREG